VTRGRPRSPAGNPGRTLAIDIQAVSSHGDNAAQKIFFRLT
jgi:hypothetical protein